MLTDKHGQIILTEDEICDLYMKNTGHISKYIYTNSVINFSKDLDLENLPKLVNYSEVENLDESFQKDYFLPKEYIDFDIAEFVLSQCKNDSELQRAGEELLLYNQYNMFDLLIYLKYLVDTMRKNNIVWGVGRGSSTASFVLYLIGLHKINSLYYDLPITEFFK